MSYITLAQQGLAAVEAKDWATAITNLTKALQTSTNPAWLLGRSKSLISLGRYEEALDDANLAWHKAYARNKRSLMVEANYRRAVAYLRQGKLADADACCVFAMHLAKGGPAIDDENALTPLRDAATGCWIATARDAIQEAQDEARRGRQGNAFSVATEVEQATKDIKDWRLASTLRIRILTDMEKLPLDDPARIATATATPPEKELVDIAGSVSKESITFNGPPKPILWKSASKQGVPMPPAAHNKPLELQEYQNNTTMSVSIFSKGVDKNQLKVDFQPRSVCLDNLINPSGNSTTFKLDLWGEINTTASKYSVTPNKVELTLAKKTPGKWAQLRKPVGSETPSSASPSTNRVYPIMSKPAHISAATDKTKTSAASRPQKDLSYPSSSRTGPKNWDKLDVDEDESNEDINSFFKKIFKNATPEQQRAMNKSFTESNGTSLSTSWNDVKDQKVETVPPEGVEEKRWN